MTAASLYQLARQALKDHEKAEIHLNDTYMYLDTEDLAAHLQGSTHGVNLTPEQAASQGELWAIHADEHEIAVLDARARLINAVEAITAPRIPSPLTRSR